MTSKQRNLLTAAAIVAVLLFLTMAYVYKGVVIERDRHLAEQEQNTDDPIQEKKNIDDVTPRADQKSIAAAKSVSRKRTNGAPNTIPELATEEAVQDILNRRGPMTVGKMDDPKTASDRDQIQAAVLEIKPQLKKCYETTLKDFPDAAGKVVLGFEIHADADGEEGRVELTELDPQKTTLFDRKLNDCLMLSISDITTDAPVDGAVLRVSYPFNFAPE